MHLKVLRGAFDVHEEHVVAKRLLGGAALDLDQVDAGVGEFGQDHEQRAGAVGLQEQGQRRLELAAREHRDMALAADESERRLVSEVILDARLGHARAVKLGGEGVADAGDGPVRRRAAGAIGGGCHGDGGDAVQVLVEVAAALRQALRVAGDRFHVVQGGLGMHDQAMMDVKHMLAQDGGARAEREIVERGGHRPFKRVLRGHYAVFAFPAVHAVEHLGQRGALDQLRVVYAQTFGECARSLVVIGSGGAQVSERGWGFSGHAKLLHADLFIYLAKI